MNQANECEFYLGNENGRKKVAKQIIQILRSMPDEERETLMGELEKKFEVQIEEANLPRALLTWDEIRTMHEGGIEFGSHTVTHPVLSKVSKEKLRFELVESKKRIEKEIGKKIIAISYPFGGKDAFNERTKQAAKNAGYEFGVSYIHEINYLDSCDFFTLNRLHIERIHNLALFKIQLYWPSLFWKMKNKKV